VSERASLQVEDGLARLELVRAGERNAIDPAMVQTLAAAVAACAAAPALRALLICADGPAFSVGGDLRHLATHLDRLPDELEAMITPYHRTLATLAQLPLPVVCAVQGPIAGGGLGLLWCADVVIASEDARLSTAFARLGLSGDGGGSWWLPRLVGMRRARQLLLGGRELSATEALEWGLVDRVVGAQELRAQALLAARELARGPTTAYGELRRLLVGALERPLAAGLDAERDACVRTSATADAREGIAAFSAGRAPRFGGR
jgi:2-(1,2-epoxy-1,2-dihydrophenyl)acetyl-CoA isomerase